eukprot:6037465-Amphidinium_carterae.1
MEASSTFRSGYIPRKKTVSLLESSHVLIDWLTCVACATGTHVRFELWGQKGVWQQLGLYHPNLCTSKTTTILDF